MGSRRPQNHPHVTATDKSTAAHVAAGTAGLLQLPEELAYGAQNGASHFGLFLLPTDETTGPDQFPTLDYPEGLKSPFESELSGANDPQTSSHAAPMLHPQAQGQNPAEFDGGVDSRYDANAYESVFPREEPLMLPNWNMPGSFKVFNGMDLDPQDAQPELMDHRMLDLSRAPNSGFPAQNVPQPYVLYAGPPAAGELVASDVSMAPDVSSQALDPHFLDTSGSFARSLSHSIAESPFSADRSPQQSTTLSFAFSATAQAPEMFLETFPESVAPFLAENGHPAGFPPPDATSNRNSISLAANELSPLTTTTSFTPSVSSHQLTQHSFFSAQQFWRSLMDLPPSLIHRASMDLYQMRRGSIESSNSAANVPARSQRSLASYFPFMDRKLPIHNTSPPDWQPMAPAPRHSIRSIFKTNNAPHIVDEEPERNFAPKHEEEEGEEKKAKRTRGIFKRFKTKPDELKPEFEDFGSVSLNQSDVHIENYDEELEDEPDYGALFSKVGKRKNFVMMGKKSEREKEKEKGEKVKVEESSFSSAEHSAESNHLFATTSGISVNSRENEPTLTFASASKRILGARLMKKKNQVKNENLTNVVEIDLQSLDLPESTEVIELQASKTRTRGRKEDKAADLEDLAKIYICGYCTRRFKRQEHLKRHFRSLHTAEKPYDCPYCKKKFSRTDNLNQHVKVHKQEEEAMAV